MIYYCSRIKNCEKLMKKSIGDLGQNSNVVVHEPISLESLRMGCRSFLTNDLGDSSRL